MRLWKKIWICEKCGTKLPRTQFERRTCGCGGKFRPAIERDGEVRKLTLMEE